MAAIDWTREFTEEYLQTLHTRQLLIIRQRLHGLRNHGWNDAEEKREAEIFRRVIKVLAKREHIPNKKEGKAARQLAAKRKT